MKKFLIMLLFSINAISQNLVPNHSFEEYSSCPNDLQNFFVNNWNYHHSTNFSSISYQLNRCSTFDYSTVPQNFYGYQDPHDGDGYLTIPFSYYGFTPTNFSTIHYSCRLLEDLIPGNMYAFKMHISVGDLSKVSLGGLGAYFVEDINDYTINNPPINYRDNLTVYGTPQVYFPDAVLNKNEWVALEGRFIATASFKYLMVGFFNNNPSTITFHNFNDMNAAQNPNFFIDDLSLVEIDKESVSIGQMNQNTFKIYPNPTTDNVFIDGDEISDFNVKVFNSLGKLLIHEKNINSLDLHKFDQGLYLLEIYSGEKIEYHKILKK